MGYNHLSEWGTFFEGLIFPCDCRGNGWWLTSHVNLSQLHRFSSEYSGAPAAQRALVALGVEQFGLGEFEGSSRASGLWARRLRLVVLPRAPASATQPNTA